MKTLITAIFTLLVITVQAQTSIQENTQPKAEQETTVMADVMIAVPMIGNINIKNCDVALQEELKPLTMIKFIRTSESFDQLSEEMEQMMAVSYEGLKEVKMPLQ